MAAPDACSGLSARLRRQLASVRGSLFSCCQPRPDRQHEGKGPAPEVGMADIRQRARAGDVVIEVYPLLDAASTVDASTRLGRAFRYSVNEWLSTPSPASQFLVCHRLEVPHSKKRRVAGGQRRHRPFAPAAFCRRAIMRLGVLLTGCSGFKTAKRPGRAEGSRGGTA